MIKNKYLWFDQERVGQGSTSPLRDARSLLKERNTTLLSVSDVVFSSFNPKSLMADKSRGEMPGVAGTKRAVREPGSGDNQASGLMVVLDRLLHQRAEAVTEWLPSLAVCMPLNASEAGMSQL